mmetsp:Transcript_13247/g.31379  ORF Transcript_13247/g.31379 Transcript_13247/m.31379 type:complete len:223 (-) Transcript_13247:1141-1809(-)
MRARKKAITLIPLALSRQKVGRSAPKICKQAMPTISPTAKCERLIFKGHKMFPGTSLSVHCAPNIIAAAMTSKVLSVFCCHNRTQRIAFWWSKTRYCGQKCALFPTIFLSTVASELAPETMDASDASMSFSQSGRSLNASFEKELLKPKRKRASPRRLTESSSKPIRFFISASAGSEGEMPADWRICEKCPPLMDLISPKPSSSSFESTALWNLNLSSGFVA